ncbi:DUF3558 domain-containing protein [Nocardia asteroides]
MAVGAVAVSAVVAGCDGGGETAAPQTTGRDLDKIVVFNVCSQLSDEVLRGVGLDPATKRTLTDPPTGPSTWRSCNWRSLDDRYGSGALRFDVFSTSHTLDETRRKDSLVNVQETTVGNRRALRFQEKNDSESCYVAFEAEQGMFEVAAASLRGGSPDVNGLCGSAIELSENLEPHLPK